MATVKFGGHPVKLVDHEVKVGQTAPDFRAQKWVSFPSEVARPLQISRRDLARPSWQTSMATNWP